MQASVVLYILAGTLSVAGIGAIDLVSVRVAKLSKPFIMLVSIFLFIASLILLIRNSNIFVFPLYVRIAGFTVAAVAAVLFIFTLFIEIPISTYTSSHGHVRVIDTGTYALSRHPGVIWMALFLSGILCAAGTRLLLIAGPIWLVGDLVLVVLQDKVVFPKRFGVEYDEYKKSTPMIMPTYASIVRCVHTFKITPETRKQ